MTYLSHKFDKHVICWGMPSLSSLSYYPHLALHPGNCQPIFVTLTLLARNGLGSYCGTNISLFVYCVIMASSGLKQMCLILRALICLLHYPAYECQILSCLLLSLILHAQVCVKALHLLDKYCISIVLIKTRAKSTNICPFKDSYWSILVQQNTIVPLTSWYWIMFIIRCNHK